jgi:Flp pilus assembly protein TadG
MKYVNVIGPSSAARVESRSGGKRTPAWLRRSERGSSAVELALVLPVLLLIMLGIFTFGVAINNALMLSNAVSNGALLLAISRGQATDPCATTAAAVYNAAPLLTPTNISFTFVLNGNTYHGTSCTAGAGNLAQGTAAQVAVTYPCDLSVFGFNYAPGCNLSAQTSELVQ